MAVRFFRSIDGRSVGLFLGFDLLAEDFDRFFKLGIDAIRDLSRGDVDQVVGLGAVEFHVFAVVREKPASAWQTKSS